MELNNYYQKIFEQLQKECIFSTKDILSIDFLKSLGNNPEQVSILDEYMNQGNITAIKNFPPEEIKTTYDDYTYLLFQLKTKSLIVSVWDSNELWDDPIIVSVKVM